MSAPETRRETNKERLEAIQELLPPRKGVRSRKGYASIDEFARRIGATRSLMAKWKNGAEPSEPYRIKLSRLSKGRYTPDDFRVHEARLPPEVLAEMTVELKGLSHDLAELRDDLAKTQAQLERVRGRVAALEARRSGPERHEANEGTNPP